MNQESSNGHGSKRAILYARVSTEEQAQTGYSLAQQMEALRQYSAREGYEVLEEVNDLGQSGASLERPGMDRVRDMVAVGDASVVLAQDRDRFAREPAYLYLLKKEFEEHGTKLRSLNERGDDSPEGQFTDDVLDVMAKFERAKIAERTRRGLLRKAREGKIIRGPKPNFGFRFNENNDQLVIYQPEMKIVEMVFRMATEGLGPKAIQTRLYAEGIPSPTGKEMWPPRIIKSQLLLNDLYKPYSYEEIVALVLPEVAARLDPSQSYGIWWYNRRSVKRKQASETDGNGGRSYKTRTSMTTRDKEDWIAVPVPACLPRELVDRARFLIASRKGYERKYRAREWELKGLMRCSCGQNMMTRSGKDKGKFYYYYRCRRAHTYSSYACSQKGIRVEKVEPLVWDFVSGVLKDPEKIRRGMKVLICKEREGARTDTAIETKMWEAKLAENTRLRRAYQDQQAAGLMTLAELRSRIEELDEVRKVAEVEVAALRHSQARAEELENDLDAVLASLNDIIPEALESLTGEERNKVYRMLHIQVTPTPEGYETSGVFRTSEPTPGCSSRASGCERQGPRPPETPRP